MEVKEREKYSIYRKRHKVKLSDVAKVLGVSIVSVSRYERYDMNFTEEHELLYKDFIKQFM